MNSINDIDWLALSNSNKKDLILIMKRAMTPIEFSSAYIITMNLESFVTVSIRQLIKINIIIKYCNYFKELLMYL